MDVKREDYDRLLDLYVQMGNERNIAVENAGREHEAASAAVAVIMSIAEVVGIPDSTPDLSRKTLAAVKELVAELRVMRDIEAADSANYKTGIGYT